MKKNIKIKKLAKYGWNDLAIRKEKQLLILVCDSPDHAKQLFKFLNSRQYRFDYKSETDSFEIKLSIYNYGYCQISITPDHQSFALRNDVLNGNICQLTTGAWLANKQLGYLKDTCPLPNFDSTVTKRLIPPVPPNPLADEPDFLINRIGKIKKPIRSVLFWK